MLFWTRALLCIGTVTIMAIQHRPQSMPQPRPMAVAPSASALAGVACRVRPDLCAAAVTRGIGMLGSGAAESVFHTALPSPERGDGRGHRAVPWPRNALALAGAGTAIPHGRSIQPQP